MEKKYSCSLFIFRRDLRIDDNTALIHALKNSKQVIPCFIVDPQQVNDKNVYRSNNALQFMIESLEDLKKQLKNRGHIYFFYGTPWQVIKKLHDKKIFSALYINSDYTPYSCSRDKKLMKVCEELSVIMHVYDDALLNEPNLLKTTTGKPYTKFTPYFKRALQEKVSLPEKNNYTNYFTGTLIPEYSPEALIGAYNKNIVVKGGRQNGLKLLKNIPALKNYEKTRNFPYLKTSLLSAHNKFGTISIREEYYTIKNSLGITSSLLKQLYWRDFYTYIAAHFPFIFGHNFLEKYKEISWENNKNFFEKWCKGMTGFPIVDAGMKELNSTGWMHNRVRMIVASFLTKDLHINWQWGEKYFAQKLVDYDPAINNGNWQWAASTGCDAQPYFRVFNPWLQQKKFDPECIYIKKWLPKLKNLPAKTIHSLYKTEIKIADYPQPIVDHTQEARNVKKKFSLKNHLK